MQIEIELGMYAITVDNVEYDPGEPDCLRGHPDNWYEGYGPDLSYDVVSITRYGDDQYDIEVLTEQQRELVVAELSEQIDDAVLEAIK